MVDREKVMRGLECCLAPNNHEDCPYEEDGKTYSQCLESLVIDAFTLLKEQEPVKAHMIQDVKIVSASAHRPAFVATCGNCSCYLLNNWKACPICGKAVKWCE